ncbi:MAG: alpha/beta hydrolase [Imperialibacter sp.]|uniref:alpha/beta hydrolase n=1 Tax=Imperialibacter sp. TaxID=2038411 RepID=UPI003A89A1D2
MKFTLIGVIFCSSLLSCAANDERYLFFLHNKWIEDHELNEGHPKYGRAEYREIVNAFKKEGFTVISEKRKANTDEKTYARKVKSQIDSLLQMGVEPGKITVVGTSKGGIIAQYVSTYARNEQLNFVFIGSSFEGLVEQIPDIDLCGNILAINEKSDRGSVSLAGRIEKSTCQIVHFKNIELNTGKEHGFLFPLMKEWFEPAVKWAREDYQ